MLTLHVTNVCKVENDRMMKLAVLRSECECDELVNCSAVVAWWWCSAVYWDLSTILLFCYDQLSATLACLSMVEWNISILCKFYRQKLFEVKFVMHEFAWYSISIENVDSRLRYLTVPFSVVILETLTAITPAFLSCLLFHVLFIIVNVFYS